MIRPIVFLGALLALGPSVFAEEASVRKDAWRRPKWVWLSTEAGYETAHLRTFEADTDNLTVNLAPSGGDGAAVGVGLGARFYFVTLGARARVGLFHDSSPTRTVGNWQLWTVEGELGFRMPFRRVEPYLTFGGGYATVGGFDDAITGLRDGLNINGAIVRGGLGVDVFVIPNLSLGVSANAGALLLARRGVPLRDLAEPKQVGTLNELKARVLEGDGTSVGWSLTLLAGPSLHF